MHPSHGHTGRGLRYPSMVPVKSDDRKGLEKNKIVPGVSVYRSLGKELNWEGETAVMQTDLQKQTGKEGSGKKVWNHRSAHVSRDEEGLGAWQLRAGH